MLVISTNTGDIYEKVSNADKRFINKKKLFQWDSNQGLWYSRPVCYQLHHRNWNRTITREQYSLQFWREFFNINIPMKKILTTRKIILYALYYWNSCDWDIYNRFCIENQPLINWRNIAPAGIWIWDYNTLEKYVMTTLLEPEFQSHNMFKIIFREVQNFYMWLELSTTFSSKL